MIKKYLITLLKLSLLATASLIRSIDLKDLSIDPKTQFLAKLAEEAGLELGSADALKLQKSCILNAILLFCQKSIIILTDSKDDQVLQKELINRLTCNEKITTIVRQLHSLNQSKTHLEKEKNIIYLNIKEINKKENELYKKQTTYKNWTLNGNSKYISQVVILLSMMYQDFKAPSLFKKVNNLLGFFKKQEEKKDALNIHNNTLQNIDSIKAFHENKVNQQTISSFQPEYNGLKEAYESSHRAYNIHCVIQIAAALNWLKDCIINDQLRNTNNILNDLYNDKNYLYTEMTSNENNFRNYYSKVQSLYVALYEEMYTVIIAFAKEKNILNIEKEQKMLAEYFTTNK